jgi:uncharacterized protein YjiK
MVRYPRLFLCLPSACVLFVLLAACDGRAGKSFLPDMPGYDPMKKEVFVLHKKLLEISGIAYLNDSVLFAVNDEDGKIFTTNLTTKKPAVVDFGKKGDYEDICYADSVFYVLESSGDIYTVPVKASNTTRKTDFPKKRKVEFESLYAEPGTGKLILLSKEQRLIDDALVAYRYDPVADTFSERPHYVIPLRDVTRLMKDHSAECKPSAAAIHPVTNKLYIVASVGKVLLICSLKGEVEKAYTLNPDLFSQPEGICFSPAGDMYISNEGLQGKATVIRFPYNPLAAGR